MTSEIRSLGEVSAVRLASVGEIEILIGSEPSIIIEAEGNLVPLITTEVSGGTLTIGTKGGFSPEPTEPIRFKVKIRRLDAAEIVGAGAISIEDPGSDRPELAVPGSGTISVSGSVDQLRRQSVGPGT